MQYCNTALLRSITAEKCNNRSNRDISVFSFFVRLCPSRFTLCAFVQNIKLVSNDNIMCTMLICTEASRFALNKPKQTSNERDQLIVCDYLRLSLIFVKTVCHVLVLMLCWSAEPLKVVFNIKMISPACVITYLFEWISIFERVVVEWTIKDSLKDSLFPLPCGEAMKLHWLTARLSCPVRFED